MVKAPGDCVGSGRHHREAAHAGTTPTRLRRNALKAAAALVVALDSLLPDREDTVRSTVGCFEIEPDSPNTVSDCDVLHDGFATPRRATLERLTGQIEALCSGTYRGCDVCLWRIEHVQPTASDCGVPDVVRRCRQSLQSPSQELLSGAGHDAMLIA